MTDESNVTSNTLTHEQMLAEVRSLAEIGMRAISYNPQVSLDEFERVSGSPLSKTMLKVLAMIGTNHSETPVEKITAYLAFIDTLALPESYTSI
jgi:hypothetical protein